MGASLSPRAWLRAALSGMSSKVATRGPARGAPAGDRARRDPPGGLRDFLEAAPDALIVVDPEGRIAMVNSEAERMFGYSPGDLPGQSVEILVPDRFREGHVAHRADYSKAPRRRPLYSGLELWGRRRDGTEFPVGISLSPTEADGGPWVIAAVRDMTDRIRMEDMARRRVAEETLRKSQTRHLWQALFRTLGSGAQAILHTAGVEAGGGTYDHLAAAWKPKDLAEALSAFREYAGSNSFCTVLDFEADPAAARATVRLTGSFEAAARATEGTREGGCHFMQGLMCGMVGRATGRTDLVCDETACEGRGDPACEFRVRPMFG